MSTDHVLRNGQHVLVRPLEPSDEDVVRFVFDGLGPQSRFTRFLSPKSSLSAADLRQLTSVDHRDHEALLASSPYGGRPIGIARVIRLRADPATAELAVAVVDDWHGRGVGGLLTDLLVARSRDLQVRRISVLMAWGNRRAAGLVRRMPGEPCQVAADSFGTEYLIAI